MSVSALQEEPLNLADVPEAYHYLRVVFSKSGALSLPLHHPSNCAIDLWPGISLPKGRLYTFSSPPCIDYQGLNDITVKNSQPLSFGF